MAANKDPRKTPRTKRAIAAGTKASWIRRNAELEALRVLRADARAVAETNTGSVAGVRTALADLRAAVSRFDRAIADADAEAERVLAEARQELPPRGGPEDRLPAEQTAGV